MCECTTVHVRMCHRTCVNVPPYTRECTTVHVEMYHRTRANVAPNMCVCSAGPPANNNDLELTILCLIMVLKTGAIRPTTGGCRNLQPYNPGL